MQYTWQLALVLVPVYCSVSYYIYYIHDMWFVFSIGQHFVAGGLAGVMTTVIMTPGERVKCLMQASTGIL